MHSISVASAVFIDRRKYPTLSMLSLFFCKVREELNEVSPETDLDVSPLHDCSSALFKLFSLSFFLPCTSVYKLDRSTSRERLAGVSLSDFSDLSPAD